MQRGDTLTNITIYKPLLLTAHTYPHCVSPVILSQTFDFYAIETHPPVFLL